MPDTFFTKPPDWASLVALYFFIGGIAAGSFTIGALLTLFGTVADRAVARLGYLIAFPGVAIGGLLLIIDLRQPLRFWHMLLLSHTLRPAFKYWSPMSLGSWILMGAGLFSFLAFVGALAELGRLPSGLAALSRGTVGKVIAAVGAIFALGLGGYTGMLLSATNRPMWADTPFLGLLFLLSAMSTATALLVLLSRRRPAETVHWLSRFDDWLLIGELVVLAIVALTIGGTVFRETLLNGWGALLLIGVILLGILVPLALHWRPSLLGQLSLESGAALVLVGGFLLRLVIVLSSQAV